MKSKYNFRINKCLTSITYIIMFHRVICTTNYKFSVESKLDKKQQNEEVDKHQK